MRQRPTSIRVAVIATFVLAAVACGDGDDSSTAAAAVECIRVRAPQIALAPDENCTVATHAFAAERLPDLAFTGGLCFTTGTADAELSATDGRVLEASIIAYSGLSTNPLAGVGLTPLPVPLVTSDGTPHVYAPFMAASVIEVRARQGGEPIGELVTRDTGWIEVKGGSTLPSFVTERLVVTGAQGALAGVVGELIASGDEFSGVPVVGSLCGVDLFARLDREL